MLHNVTSWDENTHRYTLSHDYARIDTEISELAKVGSIRASATSLLPPSIPSNIYKDIGFLLNADTVVIRCVYTEGVSSTRIDRTGDEIIWHPTKKEYCNRDMALTTYHGSFRVSPILGHLKQVDSLETLLNHLVNQYDKDKTQLDHNEVVINYKTQSIVAILAAKNRLFDVFSGSENKLIQTEASHLQTMLKDSLELDLPILVYDCNTGTLALYNRELTGLSESISR